MRMMVFKILWELLYTPYIWGGDDAGLGFDCSGLVVELLKTQGIIAEAEDYTAAQLYNKFLPKKVAVPQTGDLVFFKNTKTNKINHVEIYWDDGISIGANGGGPHIKSLNDAIKYNAFVKPRPIATKKDRFVAFIDPYKSI